MIRNFQEILQKLQKKYGAKEEPDLFEYAKQEAQRNERDAKRIWPLLLMLSLYPLFFGAGYFVGQDQSRCGDDTTEIGGSENREETIIPLSETERQFAGNYDAVVSGHKADFYIYRMKNGGIGAAIRFLEWGRHELEYLRAVRINGKQIDFIRSCRAAECARIGSPSAIYQVYTGTLNEEGDTITGTYTGGQSASGWKATRKE